MEPIVSIVTVAFNAVNVIRETIHSVIKQEFNSFEYIIIDGESVDGTLDIINEYASYLSYFVSEPDRGIYDAMNKGIDAATGEWIIFMNAGDTFISNEVLKNVFKGNVDKCIDVLYGDAILKYVWGCSLLEGHFFTPNDINLPFCHQSVFVKTKLMKEFYFNLNYKVAGDYNFFYTLYCKDKIFYHIKVPVAFYDSVGYSTNRVLETYKEVAHIRGKDSGCRYLFKVLYFRLRKVSVAFVPQRIINFYRRYKYTSLYNDKCEKYGKV